MTAVGALQAGRHTFDITLVYSNGNPQTLSGFGIVDVVSRRKYTINMCIVVVINVVVSNFIPAHSHLSSLLFAVS